MFRVRWKLGGLGLASGDVKPNAGQPKLLQMGFKAKGRRSCHLCWYWMLVVLERNVLLAFLRPQSLTRTPSLAMATLQKSMYGHMS